MNIMNQVMNHMNETCQDDWSELTKFELEVWDMSPSDGTDDWLLEYFPPGWS